MIVTILEFIVQNINSLSLIMKVNRKDIIYLNLNLTETFSREI
jgi:hypothetical protein